MQCVECHAERIVYDRSTGDQICTACGVVQESHCLDDTPSPGKPLWADVDRLGFPSSQLGCTVNNTRLSRLSGPSCQEKHLKEANREIASGAAALYLPEAIVKQAKELYRELLTKKLKLQGSLQAICVYYACKQGGVARRKLEICNAFSLEEHKFTRACHFFKDAMRHEKYFQALLAATTSSDLLQRNLNFFRARLPKDVFKRLWREATRLDTVINKSCALEGKTPIAVTAAVIYLACIASGLTGKETAEGVKPICKRDVLEATGVSAVTLNRMLEDVHAQQENVNVVPPCVNAATEP